MNEYNIVAYMNEKIKQTDEIYNNQYPYLFPDIYDKQTMIADKMDEPPSGLSYSFIAKVEDEYRESWKTNNEIPQLSMIEDYMISCILEEIERICDEEFRFDRRYWEDEEFRENQLTIYEDDYWSSGEGMNFDSLLRKALNYLEFTYVDDLWDSEVRNAAQRRVFKENEVVGAWRY